VLGLRSVPVSKSFYSPTPLNPPFGITGCGRNASSFFYTVEPSLFPLRFFSISPFGLRFVFSDGPPFFFFMHLSVRFFFPNRLYIYRTFFTRLSSTITLVPVYDLQGGLFPLAPQLFFKPSWCCVKRGSFGESLSLFPLQ